MSLSSDAKADSSFCGASSKMSFSLVVIAFFGASFLDIFGKWSSNLDLDG